MGCLVKSSAAEIISSFGGESSSELEIIGVSSAGDPKPRTLTFLRAWSDSSQELVEAHPETVFLVPLDAPTDLAPERVARVESPRLAYAQAVRRHLLPSAPAGVSARAEVGESVQLGDGVSIGAFAVIEDGVSIGDGTLVEPHAVLKSGVTVGERCRIGAHTVIGTAGFGYEFDEQGAPILIPHLGGVEIGNDVEIGNHVSIAQGTIDPTVIRDHVKIDDCVFIAHNCFIDEASYVIAGAQISGSVHVGKRVWISPEVSVINKVSIGDDALLGLGSVVVKDVPANVIVSGVPAKVIRPRHAVAPEAGPEQTGESSDRD